MPLATQPDGSLTGSFSVDKQGFYRIELNGPHGEQVKASPQYMIDVLSDQGPSVKFSKPGRDTQASPVEEVLAEVRADDDFGVKQRADVLRRQRRPGKNRDALQRPEGAAGGDVRRTRFISRNSV